MDGSGQARIDDREMLARFIVTSSWVRADVSIRPEAFIPHPHPSLSVDRHAALSDAEIWLRGGRVAHLRGKPLVGRADVSAGRVRDPSTPTIDVVPAPLTDDPEHASIIGWPGDKFGQKIIAQRIAAGATFVAVVGEKSA